MSDDQLEEYRRRMQMRHSNNSSSQDRNVPRQIESEEEKRQRERLNQDEEIAKKLQEQYQPIPNYYQNPPVDSQRQPLLQRESCLPVVDEKCCGINAQTCVLGMASAMTMGIIALIIMLATS